MFCFTHHYYAACTLFTARFGFNRADQITVFFCGSKKTLASGVPMAQILFIGQPLGMIVLPIMIFHQIQLMVCGVIANYLAKSQD
ncbi:bile acid:sodium symporter [Acinetobacter baumannii]|nr:bile acid:sodium symporter [Acinetobacter baumannii]